MQNDPKDNDLINDPGTPSQAEGEDDPGSSASDNPHGTPGEAEGEDDETAQ